MLLSFLSWEAFNDEETREKFETPPLNITIVLTRFVAAVFLHFILTEETKQGLAMMKFANNHWWKFDSWSTAYMVGFTQLLYVVLVETINMIILITNNFI